MTASTSCDCPSPPGGRVTCEADEIAVCYVSEGKLFGRCLRPDPVDRLSRPLRGALSDASPTERPLLQVISALGRFVEEEIPAELEVRFPDPETDSFLRRLRLFLEGGVLVDSSGETVGYFRLPAEEGPSVDPSGGGKGASPTPSYEWEVLLQEELKQQGY